MHLQQETIAKNNPVKCTHFIEGTLAKYTIDAFKHILIVIRVLLWRQ
jgi:hypothetical protein